MNSNAELVVQEQVLTGRPYPVPPFSEPLLNIGSTRHGPPNPSHRDRLDQFRVIAVRRRLVS